MASVTESLFGSLLGVPGQGQAQAVQQAYQPVSDGMGMFLGQIRGTGEELRQGIGRTFGQEPVADQQKRKLQAIVQATQQQVDVGTPEGLAKLAENLNQFPEFSGISLALRQQAAQLAQEKETKSADILFKQAQAAQMSSKATQAPKDERSPEKKKMDELIAQGLSASEARSIAYKTQGVDFRREMAEEKKADKKRSLEEKQQNTITTIDNVVNKVDDALSKVGTFTAGAGSIFSVIPGTEAKDLASTVETIKANLGFDRLQRMRDASPTGGALGQVAVQELTALQSSVSSLDISQSPAQLKKNLEAIKRHYQNWRNAILKSQQGGQETPIPSTASTPIAPQSTTKQVVKFIRDAQGNIVRQ